MNQQKDREKISIQEIVGLIALAVGTGYFSWRYDISSFGTGLVYGVGVSFTFFIAFMYSGTRFGD